MAVKTPEGAEDTVIDYYDIMIIGRTGMGKSTTADKLIIANPDGHDYCGEQHDDEIVENGQVKKSDLTMWLLADVEDEKERVETRLKNLVFFRSLLPNPHKEVNKAYRRPKMQTVGSQVVSNETTRVRVLDVPGFLRGVESMRNESTGDKVTRSGLLIMREILRIQSMLRMEFQRIIYFIPDRGTLERSHSMLTMELEQMEHYFGKSIFECMVLVATVSPDVSEYLPENVTPLNEAITRSNFKEALSRVLPNCEQIPDDKPPIVFISMNDSCERILEKIKNAQVICDELKLAFDNRTCIRCGIKARILKYKDNRQRRVACYAGDDPTASMPYKESHCHPLIVSKYWTFQKIVGGIAHFITGNRYRDKWPGFRNRDDEVCINCGRVPSEPGCKKIGSHYRLKDKIIIVDHTPTEPVVDGGQGEVCIDLQVDEHRPFEQEQGDAEPANKESNDRDQRQQSGRVSPPASEERLPPVVQGEQSQTLRIEVDIEPERDVAPPLTVGTPDIKG